jgi:hypothetical protein
MKKYYFLQKILKIFVLFQQEKSKFLNYVLRPYIWSSFVGLNELIPNICWANSGNLQLVSYDLEKYLEKPAVKKPCLNFLQLILGRFS